MDTNKITLTTPADLICYLPYILGYQPIDRFCVFSLSPSAPTAAIEQPHGSDSLLGIVGHLKGVYSDSSGTVALVVYTDYPAHALATIDDFTYRLAGPIAVAKALIVTSDGHWYSTTGETGTVTDEDRGRVAAATEFLGMAPPAPARMTDQPGNDREGLDQVQPYLTVSLGEDEGPDADEFVMADRARESANAAARLIADLDITTPDGLTRWKSHQNSRAVIIALTTWLTDTGSLMWQGLKLFPVDPYKHPTAEVVADALNEALAPNRWTGWSTRAEA